MAKGRASPRASTSGQERRYYNRPHSDVGCCRRVDSAHEPRSDFSMPARPLTAFTNSASLPDTSHAAPSKFARSRLGQLGNRSHPPESQAVSREQLVTRSRCTQGGIPDSEPSGAELAVVPARRSRSQRTTGWTWVAAPQRRTRSHPRREFFTSSRGSLGKGNLHAHLPGSPCARWYDLAFV